MMRIAHRFILAIAALVVTACSDDVIVPVQDESLLLPWSELSGRITYATPSQLILIDAVEREVRVLRDVTAGELFVDVASSPEDDEVAIGVLHTDGTNHIAVVGLDGTLLRTIARATCGRWLPDGRLSYMRGDSVFVEGGLLTVLDPEPWSCPTWSVDGSYFLISLTDTVRRSQVYRVATSNPIPEMLELVAIGGPLTSWNDPAVAPGGQLFAVIYASDDPIVEVLLASTSGGIIAKLAAGTRLFGLSWSPDGAQMLAVSTVSSAGGLFVIRATDGAIRKLVEHPVFAAAWGP